MKRLTSFRMKRHRECSGTVVLTMIICFALQTWALKVQAQVTTVSYVNMGKAFDLNGDYGVIFKQNPNGSATPYPLYQSVRVEVYSKKRKDAAGEDQVLLKSALIYGFQVVGSNSRKPAVSDIAGFESKTYPYFQPASTLLPPADFPLNSANGIDRKDPSGNWVTQLATLWKNYLLKEGVYTGNLLGTNSAFLEELEVEIVITPYAGLSLSQVDSILLPGLDPITFSCDASGNCWSNSNGDDQTFAFVSAYGCKFADNSTDPNKDKPQAVATLVSSWQPDYVVSIGDDDYGDKGKSCYHDLPATQAARASGTLGINDPILESDLRLNFDENTGTYYGAYIGSHRFYTTPGEHDYYYPEDDAWCAQHTSSGTTCDKRRRQAAMQAWEDYFKNPDFSFAPNNATGNGRTYSFKKGDIHFFMVNTVGSTTGKTDSGDDVYTYQPNPNLPNYNPDPGFDKIDKGGPLYNWLKKELEASVALDPDAFRIVVTHFGPYSTSIYNNRTDPNNRKFPLKEWPLKKWGASIVLSSDNRYYERAFISRNDERREFDAQGNYLLPEQRTQYWIADADSSNAELTYITYAYGGFPALRGESKSAWAPYAYMHIGRDDSNGDTGLSYFGSIKATRHTIVHPEASGEPDEKLIHFQYITYDGKVLDDFYLEADGTIQNYVPSNNPNYVNNRTAYFKGEISYPSPDSTSTLKSFSNSVKLNQYSWAPDKVWEWKNSTTGKTERKSQHMTVAEIDISQGSDLSDYNMEVYYKYGTENTEQTCSGTSQSAKETTFNKFNTLNRVVARKGALFAVNGTVLDYNYNSIPGVISYIKRNGVVLSKSQIASYKSDGGFGWNNGDIKNVSFFPRGAIGADNTKTDISNAFTVNASQYDNFFSGLTLMRGSEPALTKTYAPAFVTNYTTDFIKNIVPADYGKVFPKEFLSATGSVTRAGTAGKNEADYFDFQTRSYFPAYRSANHYGDCSATNPVTGTDTSIKYFSSYTYKEYGRYFKNNVYARTFVALRKDGAGNKLRLDFGVIDGDAAQTQGMDIPEMNDFAKYKGYDYLINLDGSSSSSFFLNGFGPVYDWDGYADRNQSNGAFYQRLLQSALMIVPKQKLTEIKPYADANNKFIRLVNEEYTDFNAMREKQVVCLSPSLDKLNAPGSGLIAGNFRITDTDNSKGAILFSESTDGWYYYDNNDNFIYKPQNLTVMGVGAIPDYLKSALLLAEKSSAMSQADYDAALGAAGQVNSNDQGFYYIKIKDNSYQGIDETVGPQPRAGQLIEYFFIKGLSELTNPGTWHSFCFWKDGTSGAPSVRLSIDGMDYVSTTTGDASLVKSINDNDFSNNVFTNIYLEGHPQELLVTHAMLGGCNVDGRYVTGSAQLDLDNIILAIGDQATAPFKVAKPDLANIIAGLSLPDPGVYGNYLYNNGVYAFQFEEGSGYHSFALDNTAAPTQSRCYALNVNASRISYASQARTSASARVEEKPEAEAAKLMEKDTKRVSIYPNPLNGKDLSVAFTVEKSGPVRIVVTTLDGRSLFAKSLTAEAGSQTVTISDIGRALSQALYVVKVITTEFEHEELIIANQ